MTRIFNTIVNFFTLGAYCRMKEKEAELRGEPRHNPRDWSEILGPPPWKQERRHD